MGREQLSHNQELQWQARHLVKGSLADLTGVASPGGTPSAPGHGTPDARLRGDARGVPGTTTATALSQPTEYLVSFAIHHLGTKARRPRP